MRPIKKVIFGVQIVIFLYIHIIPQFWHFQPNSDHNLKSSTDHQKSFFNFVTFIRPAKKGKEKRTKNQSIISQNFLCFCYYDYSIYCQKKKNIQAHSIRKKKKKKTYKKKKKKKKKKKS